MSTSIPFSIPIEDIASRVTTLGPADAVLVAGSQSLGLAHANSDYDVYVVTNEPVPASREFGSKTYYDNTLIDVSYVPSSTVDRFVEILRTSDALTADQLDHDDLELMWRLVIGTPIDNEPAVADLQRALGRQRVADLIGRWRANNAQHRYLDGLFLLEHGSPIAGAVILRESAVETACAAITEAGFAYFDTKYLFDQIAMAGLAYADLLDALWQIESLPIAETDAIRTSCQALGQRWVRGTFASASLPHSWATATLARPLTQSLTHAGDGTVVWNRTQTYVLSTNANLIWQALDADPGTTVADLTTKTNLSPEIAAHVIHDLVTHGLARINWSPVIANAPGASA